MKTASDRYETDVHNIASKLNIVLLGQCLPNNVISASYRYSKMGIGDNIVVAIIIIVLRQNDGRDKIAKY